MPIVSSQIASDATQSDGRRWIRELHTDHLGIKHERNYLSRALWDAFAALTEYATQLATNLKQAEISGNIARIITKGSLAVTVLDHSTVDENFSVLRTYYKTATELEAIMSGDFLSARTDAQLKNLFGYNQAQVDNLRSTKLTPAAQSAAAIRAAAGV